MMGRPITMDQLRQDVGPMVEKITKVITSFRNFRLTMQEYVCLKVVAMLSNQEGRNQLVIQSELFTDWVCSGNVQDRELEQIHSRYMNCLRTFIEYNYPQEPNRVQELLVKLPEVGQESFILIDDNNYSLGSRGCLPAVGIQDVLRSFPT